MKSLVFTLLLSIIYLISFGQENKIKPEHLNFKGTPIDGTPTEYVAKMKQNGFKLNSSEKGIAILQGDFAGYKDCIVGVSTLQQKDLVYKIAVIFPEREDWSSLSNNYFSLKELLTEKYGEPTENSEKFQSYTPDSDGSKMTQVLLGACKYYSIYEIDKGTIQLSIKNDGVNSCNVTLAYFDKINGDIIKMKAKGDL